MAKATDAGECKMSVPGRWVFDDKWQTPPPFSMPYQVKQDIKNAGTGWAVKINNGRERFWTLIQSVQKDELVGQVNNDLVATEKYRCGDYVRFSRRHIWDVLPPAKQTHLQQLLVSAGVQNPLKANVTITHSSQRGPDVEDRVREQCIKAKKEQDNKGQEKKA